MARVVFLLCALVVSVHGGILAVKGYYCQDPDTGRLYGVNATWPSTSFCGNYTCKVRLRNQNNMVQAPSPPIVNVTSSSFRMQESDEINKKRLAETNENSNKEKAYYKNKELENYLTNIQNAMGQGIDDRYLNHEEIKTISELLPTVKKSDLEAIIEIYNLAQDIYKEMDSAPPNDEVKETVKVMAADEGSRSKTNELKSDKNNHISYWYEPLGFNGFRNTKQTDMKSEGSELKLTSYNPHEIKNTQTRPTTPPQPMLPFVTIKLPMPLNMQPKQPVNTKNTPQPGVPLYAYPQSASQPSHQREADTSFFTGPVLTNRDFGRLAYYYPMSNMQKLAYYTQKSYEPPVSNVGVASTSSRLPCHPGCRNNQYMRLYKDEAQPKPTPHKPAENRVLLPIPITFQAINGSTNPSHYNNYYKGNPWAFYNFYKNNPPPYQPPMPGQPQAQKSLIHGEISDFENEELKPIDNIDDEKLVVPGKPKDDVKPWQTDPLEQIVIDEIRANILERAKLLKLPFKKRIKLERVAKVINLDHLNRNKRQADVASPIKQGSTQNNEVYEVFLEKTTCMSSTEPGFFRVGNLSQPFPACCPQKIEAKYTQKNLGIIGGHDVAIEETPYVVALYRNGVAIGAGSIVHEQFILTSASIVEWASLHSFQVLVGSDRLSTGEIFADVTQYHCHEGYNGRVNDICLLQLSNPVTIGPKLGKVALPDKDLQLEDGLYVNTTGWGEMKNAYRPDHLQQTQVPLLPDNDCAELYPSMEATMICAYSHEHDTCRGDSGGPMTFNDVQIGVAVLSYSNYCGQRPSVYTRVSKYVDWIDTKISQNL